MGRVGAVFAAAPTDLAPVDPTRVLGRRVLAATIDALIGLVIASLVLVPVLDGHATKRTYASGSAAAAHCRAINHATTDKVFPKDGSDGAVSFSSGAAKYCIAAAGTTYTFDGRGLIAVYGALFLATLAQAILLAIVLQGLTGFTVGKALTGLRVVRDDGRKPGLGWAALRWLLLLVDAFCLLGLIVAAVSRGHRRIGDMAAGTYVVRRADAGRPVVLPGPAPAVTTWGGVAGQPGWAPTSFPPPAAVDGPQWDEARDTYIQFDRSVDAWVQWDEVLHAWKPIDT